MTAVDVVTLGETMGLLSAHEIGPWRNGHHMILGIAGSETNVAIGLRRLGHSVAWIGRVGSDAFGELILRELRAERVDTSHAIVDADTATGLMFKTRRTTVTSEVVYSRRGSAGSMLCPTDIDVDAIASARLLHITGITAALSPTARQAVARAVDIAQEHRVPISMDVNYRSALWSEPKASAALKEFVKHAAILFASENEAALLVGDLPLERAADALVHIGPAQVIIKRGELGYTALIDGTFYAGEAVPVAVADPVGAGDAFVAAYLASWLDGAPPADALIAANHAGSFVVAVPGDWEGLPTSAELRAFARRTDAVSR